MQIHVHYVPSFYQLPTRSIYIDEKDYADYDNFRRQVYEEEQETLLETDIY